MSNHKKTQLVLPGFRVAVEATEVASGKSGSTAWYYICNRSATLMLVSTPDGLAAVPYDLQGVIPHLFSYRAALTEVKRWQTMCMRRWPYEDPLTWPSIRAKW